MSLFDSLDKVMKKAPARSNSVTTHQSGSSSSPDVYAGTSQERIKIKGNAYVFLNQGGDGRYITGDTDTFGGNSGDPRSGQSGNDPRSGSKTPRERREAQRERERERRQRDRERERRKDRKGGDDDFDLPDDLDFPDDFDDPDEGYDPDDPFTDVDGELTPNARHELQRILDAFGLGDLAEMVYDLQKVGVTLDEQTLFELRNTEAFRAMFPGIRDLDTDQLLMTPAQYLNYSNSVNEMMADAGLRQLTRAEIGALVQNRRSLGAVQEDVAQMMALQANVSLRREFYAYTGVDPGGPGLLALTFGLAPNLQALYDQAVANGVSLAEYEDRLSSYDPDGPLTLNAVTQALQPFGSGFAAPSGAVNRYDLLYSFQRAQQAREAQQKAGGMIQSKTDFAFGSSATF